MAGDIVKEVGDEAPDFFDKGPCPPGAPLTSEKRLQNDPYGSMGSYGLNSAEHRPNTDPPCDEHGQSQFSCCRGVSTKSTSHFVLNTFVAAKPN